MCKMSSRSQRMTAETWGGGGGGVDIDIAKPKKAQPD